MNPLIELCMNVAQNAHAGICDRAGVDYFEGHLSHVASNVEGVIPVCVAYLHDVIEDTTVSESDLLNALSEHEEAEEIVSAVVALTKIAGEDYCHYLERVRNNDVARIVKIADLNHNSDLNRLDTVTESDLLRLEKYKFALSFLGV